MHRNATMSATLNRSEGENQWRTSPARGARSPPGSEPTRRGGATSLSTAALSGQDHPAEFVEVVGDRVPVETSRMTPRSASEDTARFVRRGREASQDTARSAVHHRDFGLELPHPPPRRPLLASGRVTRPSRARRCRCLDRHLLDRRRLTPGEPDPPLDAKAALRLRPGRVGVGDDRADRRRDQRLARENLERVGATVPDCAFRVRVIAAPVVTDGTADRRCSR
jgi:hypothetical protein